MSKRKLRKFSEVAVNPYVYQIVGFRQPGVRNYEGEIVDLKGSWAKEHFGNDHPLTLELACGKGEYSIGLSRLYPDRNFIGVDIKGNRIWRGAKIALEEKLPNVAFLRTQIRELELYFATDEISEIWITFPDPHLRECKSNKRLTSPPFLDVYRKICKPGACINLKTDSKELFDFTLEVIEEQKLEIVTRVDDVYAMDIRPPVLTIQTFYEGMHLEDGRTIYYLRFVL